MRSPGYGRAWKPVPPALNGPGTIAPVKAAHTHHLERVSDTSSAHSVPRGDRFLRLLLGLCSRPHPPEDGGVPTGFEIRSRLPDLNASTSISPDNMNLRNDFSWNRQVWAMPSSSR